MREGISTACLYPMRLEESLATLLKMGFRLFEIFINTFSELTPGYIKNLQSILDGYGAQVKSIHPFTSGYEGFLLFSDYKRRYRDALTFYEQYFAAANILGAEIVVLHGQRDYANSSISEMEYCSRYEELFELGKRFGITVAQENVNKFRSESPGFIRRMRRYTNDNCAFVFDIKQAVRAEQDPYEMCEAMGDRIVHVHINDNDPSSDCLLPGSGAMNYQKLRKMLCSFGFDGDLIIEVYRKSFEQMEELYEAKRVVDDLL